jgi:zinc and cadmium transporter
MNLLNYMLLFFVPLLSGLSIFLFRKGDNKTRLKLFLAFSGSYLFSISILHILPEIYSHTANNIGIYILAGFFFQILLELFSEGIEHGHVHKHASMAFPSALIFSLCIHSFLEGMPLAEKSNLTNTHNSLLMGIVLHHIPVAFALMSMLLESKMKILTAVICLLLFSFMAPFGALVSNAVSQNLIVDLSLYFDKMMGIVVGIFLHISTTILFESSENHRFNLYKFSVILIGALLAIKNI